MKAKTLSKLAGKSKSSKGAESKAKKAIEASKAKRKRTKADVPSWMKNMSKNDLADLLGMPKRDAEGVSRNKAGGQVKKTYRKAGGPVRQRYAMATGKK